MQPAARSSPLARLVVVLQHRDLVAEMVRKEFVTRYHGSLFGVLWTQLYPLLWFVTYFVLFTVLLHRDVPGFAFFMFTGVVLWHFCSASIQLCTDSIVMNEHLIARAAFPTEVFPVAAVIIAGVDLLTSHVVLLAAAVAYGVWPSPSWLALPGAVVLLGLLCLGLGLVLAAAAVYWRDLRWIVEVGMLVVMFLSPIFYGDESLPPAYALLPHLNPFWAPITLYRHAFVAGAVPIIPLFESAVWASVALAAGLALFAKMRRGFVDAF